MAATDPAAVGRRIAEARARAGLSQAELAGLVAINRSSLAKIETGNRGVSALELARIADAVGYRIEWFLEDPPPVIVSRRNNAEPDAPSAALDDLVERFARSVEFVAAHDDTFELRTPAQLTQLSSADDAEHAAADARQLLGVDDLSPVLEISDRLAAIGLLTYSVDLGPDAADGASILLTQGGVALINSHFRVGRRRLTGAHELGHYLFMDEFVVDWRIAVENKRDRWESLIDRFARAVLLPPHGIERAWRAETSSGNLRRAAVRTASIFRVDMSTLARRLLELGIVGDDDAQRIRLVRTTKADIVELDLLVPDELAAAEFPRTYVEAVLRLYRSQIVSAARATDLLLDTWDEADLPELPSLPENAIWTFVS